MTSRMAVTKNANRILRKSQKLHRELDRLHCELMKVMGETDNRGHCFDAVVCGIRRTPTELRRFILAALRAEHDGV